MTARPKCEVSNTPEDGLDSYLTITDETMVPKRSVIYEGRPDRLYWVTSGRVRVFRDTADGRRTNIGLYGPGSLFGDAALLPDSMPETAVALDGATFMSWSVERFLALVESKPGMNLALLRHFAARNEQMARRVAEMSHPLNAQRLALALLRMSEGQAADEHGLTHIAWLSQQYLGDEIGCTRERATCHMVEFSLANAVTYDRKAIWIDRAALEAFAHSSDGRGGGNHG